MEIKVGMADLNVCSGTDSITTLGLGSCVGVVLWDPASHICGMVHVMLPDSTSIRNNTNVAKFADSGIDELLKRVLAKGAKRQNLVAKIAGGAKMFTVNNKSEMLSIGDRNVEASISKLKELKIPSQNAFCSHNWRVISTIIGFFSSFGQRVIIYILFYGKADG